MPQPISYTGTARLCLEYVKRFQQFYMEARSSAHTVKHPRSGSRPQPPATKRRLMRVDPGGRHSLLSDGRFDTLNAHTHTTLSARTQSSCAAHGSQTVGNLPKAMSSGDPWCEYCTYNMMTSPPARPSPRVVSPDTGRGRETGCGERPARPRRHRCRLRSAGAQCVRHGERRERERGVVGDDENRISSVRRVVSIDETTMTTTARIRRPAHV